LKEPTVERERLHSILESLFFSIEEPLTPQRLCEVVAEAEKEDVLSVIEELQAEYEQAGRGFRLVAVAGGYQLRTLKENAPWVRALLQGRPVRMSRPTLETLAIIAYKQPITRAEIESIRGVDVDGVISSLLERRLIKIMARKDVPGRPFLYGTTPEFLEVFGLKDLSELPTLRELREVTLPPQAEEELSPAQNED
jgi:segregation and condensation protein B